MDMSAETRPGAPVTVSPTSRLPNFLVIGAMKAGTTSLWHYLRTHPQVFMPDVKEVMFFDPRHNWSRGIGWYERQFQGATDRQTALGEASTSYTKFPVVREVPARIASILPDVRLLYVLRHPIERMQSHYLYALSRGKERRPIERAFAEDPSYLDISRYGLQLEQYASYFSPQQFLFIDSRDLAAKRVETLRTVFGFLGVDDGWIPPIVDREFFRSSERRMKPAMPQRLRRIPGLAAITQHAPRSVKTLARRLPTEPVDVDRARLSDEVRHRLEASLREDVARVRPYMPDGFDGWGIA
jgi:hypothetical protein